MDSVVFRFTVLVAAAAMQGVVVARGVAFLLETIVVAVAAPLFFQRSGEPPPYFWEFAARTAAGVMVLALLILAVRLKPMPASITLAPRALVAAALFAAAIVVMASGLSDIAAVVGRMATMPSAGLGGVGEAAGAVVRTLIIGGLFVMAGYAVRPRRIAAPAAAPAI